MTTTQQFNVVTLPKPNGHFYQVAEYVNGAYLRNVCDAQNTHRFNRRFAIPVLLLISNTCAIAQTSGPISQSPSTADSQSADEASKQAANPLANAWLMQFQQNNNWIGMPPTLGLPRIQSDLQFQPLLSLKFSDDWNLIARPVLQLFNTTPFQGPAGNADRMTGYGDTIFAFALSPGHSLVGNWLLAAGPTFIFPTATESLLGQHKWQFGPTVAVGYLSSHFIIYAFPQQWFSIGGNGRRASQMSVQYAFVYFLSHGWSVGTNPNMFVDWAASRGNQLTFPLGPQVGKLTKIGPLPVKFDVQVQHYPIHPQVYGAKWNIQLQVTPVLPSLIKRKIF